MEAMYAFVEVSAPEPWARLKEPVIVHVDQTDINGSKTITVSAANKKLPTLTLLKRDKQTKEVIPGTHFEVKGITAIFHNAGTKDRVRILGQRGRKRKRYYITNAPQGRAISALLRSLRYAPGGVLCLRRQ